MTNLEAHAAHCRVDAEYDNNSYCLSYDYNKWGFIRQYELRHSEKKGTSDFPYRIGTGLHIYVQHTFSVRKRQRYNYTGGVPFQPLEENRPFDATVIYVISPSRIV